MWFEDCIKDFREVCEESGEGCPVPLYHQSPMRLQAADLRQKGWRRCVRRFSIYITELRLGHTL